MSISTIGAEIRGNLPKQFVLFQLISNGKFQTTAFDVSVSGEKVPEVAALPSCVMPSSMP